MMLPYVHTADVFPLSDFTVQLDTGSSDLWLNTAGREFQVTNTSDVMAVETFGLGQAQGNVAFAQLQIGDFTIESQGASCLPCPLHLSRLTEDLQHF